jgi:hypothetical protein
MQDKKNKQKNEQKSSQKVAEFLEKNKIHKKDFAQMIGVTLSYVYNLIDEAIPFSTRSTTLERVATVMDIAPEEFDEYVISSDPVPYDKNLESIKDYMKKNKLSTVEFLKKFERKKRLQIVDILRGAKPLFIDFSEFKKIGEILNIKDEELFNLWKNVFVEHLEDNGFDEAVNRELLDAMFNGAKKYAVSKK